MKIVSPPIQEVFFHRKPFFFIFLSLLVTISLCSLDTTLAEEETGEAGSASLLVTVRDEDGTPVGGAGIMLYSFTRTMDHTGSWSGSSSGEHKGTTADDGSVKIENLEPGTYKIIVQADGYMPEKMPDIVLLEGDERQVGLRLARGDLTISGRVEDEEGRPLPETSVRFFVSKKTFPFRDYISRYDSDKDGRFQCDGLKKGFYNIEFNKEGVLKKEVQKIPAGTTGLKVVLEGGCALSGTIRTAEGAVPKEGVRIRLKRARSSGSKSVELAESGHYRLEGVEPGTIRLSAETESLTSKKDVEVVLQSGQVLPGIDFRLYPGLSISGRVVSSVDGSPIAGISVSARDKKHDVRKRGKTDSGGEYFISRLNPGLYTVVPRFGSRRERKEIEQKVELKPGERRENVDFAIELPPEIGISGRVVTERGSAAPRAQIDVLTFRKKDAERRSSYSIFPLTHSDDNGEFAFKINRFPKVIVLAKDEDHAWSQSQPILTDDSTQEYEVTIRLEKGMAISGSVKDQSLQPIKGATISLFGGRRTFSKNKTWRPMAETETDEEGNYHFDHVPLGQNTVVASMEGFSRESRFIACSPGAPEQGYDFVLKPGGKISGFVTDEHGRPVVRAMVHCTERTAPGHGVWKRNIQTDRAGYFEYRNLAQGSYALRVRHADFCGFRKENINPSDDHLTITLQKGHQLAGRILSAVSGEPVEDYEITLKRKEGPEKWKRVYCPRHTILYERGGKFTIRHLEEGEYSVVVEADGYESTKAGPLTIPSKKKSKPLVVALNTGYAVAGTVRSVATGEPVERATVQVLDPNQSPQNLEERILGSDRTSGKGRFKISGLKKGDWSLLVSRRGYSHYQMKKLPPSDDPSGQTLEIDLETDPDELSPNEWRLRGLGFSMEPDDKKKKILIKKVYEGGAAQRSGLRPGDHVVAVNGEKISHPWQAINELRSPGDTATFEVMRAGEKGPIEIKIKKEEDYDPLLW